VSEAGGQGTDLAALVDMMPFARRLGIQLASADPAEVHGSLAWSPELCTTGGMLHGGAVMALADSVGGICAFLNLPAGAGTATISSSTSFLRGVRGGVLQAVARPLHAGRTVIVVQTSLTDERGKLAAQVTQTQAVLGQ
jgi:1,4-dihydroxy-2-naphthoyl-CoA hydrolase